MQARQWIFVATMLVTLGLTTNMASAHLPVRITELPVEQSVRHIFDSGHALDQIDNAFSAGTLTWSEAQALYAEQGVIRHAFIEARTDMGWRIAAERAAFMLRVAQSTFVKLAYNDRKRIDRKTWLSSLY